MGRPWIARHLTRSLHRAELFGSDRFNFFGDRRFLEEPRSLHRTAFHQDAPYFHLEGNQCCTMWSPLDVVDRGCIDWRNTEWRNELRQTRGGSAEVF